jgi:hypothetical protein
MTVTVSDILTDIDLVLDLIDKITANVAAAKDVLATDTLADAKAKLATIQQQGAALDAAFDAAAGVVAP